MIHDADFFDFGHYLKSKFFAKNFLLPAPPRLQYDPKNPLADANGYVTLPNVNPVEEMVNMISASRSYQTNADMMNAAKTMLLKTLQLGQS